MKPSSVGLAFGEFRPGQEDAIKAIARSDARVFLYQAPVGSGKSAVALGAMNLLDENGMVLTTDLQLQSQYAKDYGVINMEGRKHFPCILAPPRKADTGICTVGLYCPYKEAGCPYYDQRRHALEQPRYVTSYAMQVSLLRVGETGNIPRKMVIADEAHRLEGVLVDQFTLEFNHLVAEKAGVPLTPKERSLEPLQAWCKRCLPEVAWLKKSNSGTAALAFGKLLDAMEALLRLSNPEDWVVLEGTYSTLVKPLDVAPFFNAIGPPGTQVLLMSSTLLNAQYQVKLFGLGEDEWQWREDPMRFPKARRPIHLLSSVQVAAKRPESYDKVIALADRHIMRHQEEKGLIHTGNYALAERMKQVSKQSRSLLFYTSATRREMIAKFRKARAPAYLVGPSLTEGLDMPYEHITQQLLLKLPIPNLRDPWVAARRARDSNWDGFQTASAVVQAYGRGVRSVDDWSEFWVLDANIKWHLQRWKHYYPRWFKDAIVWE
jgi:ATP-dependent DNA helicase DinG